MIRAPDNAHFQGLHDAQKELTNNDYRLIADDSIAPLHAILRRLAEKGYNGALSVELFGEKLFTPIPIIGGG